jgi:deazaflavin-dependent oxidoreductase (nitroreductase family)
MTEKTGRPFTPVEEKIVHVGSKVLTRTTNWVYRVSGGKIGGRWLRGAPVMLLTTIGRKSNLPRTVPVLYLRDGENVIIVASKAGVSQHPVWYRNLEANPEVEIEIGREKRKMTSRRATDEEKAALWPRLVAMYRDYDDYQARTKRDIPVVILSPR